MAGLDFDVVFEEVAVEASKLNDGFHALDEEVMGPYGGSEFMLRLLNAVTDACLAEPIPDPRQMVATGLEVGIVLERRRQATEALEKAVTG